MGILGDRVDVLEMLFITGKLPENFSVCELGDQFITEPMPRRLARDWYVSWGCSRYVSLDSNGNNGSRVVDLNRSLPLDETFDLVTDFGTGEHVFDQRRVWESLHRLTRVGGYIAFDRPCAGYAEHCFYLINECLVRDLAAANGYATEELSYRDMPRGRLIRGVLRRKRSDPFRVPHQGRYTRSSRL